MAPDREANGETRCDAPFSFHVSPFMIIFGVLSPEKAFLERLALLQEHDATMIMDGALGLLPVSS